MEVGNFALKKHQSCVLCVLSNALDTMTSQEKKLEKIEKIFKIEARFDVKYIWIDVNPY